MKFKFLIAVVAALTPLSLGQNFLNGLDLSSLGISNSQSQSQAQAQAQAQSNSYVDQSAQLQAFLNSLQPGAVPVGGVAVPPVAGAPILSGLAYPGAASPLPAVNPFTNQDAIQESLAETNLATRIRQGAIQVVPPNLSAQTVLQSVHVPVQGRYGNRVYATAPLPPTVVTQPGAPTIQVSSGPAAEVRVAPVIYRQPPSVIYQNEIITRQPAPLSLNPVYVKVYKPGQKAVAPNTVPLPATF